MGGSISTATIDMLNETAVNASMRTINQCTTTASQDQLIEMVSAKNITLGDINMTQGVNVNTKCLLTAEKQNQIQNDISNAIAQQAEAMGSGITSALGGSQSHVAANIKNRFSANLNMDTINESINSTMQRQAIHLDAGGNIIVGNINMDQSAAIVAEGIMNDAQYSTIIASVANDIDQASKAVTTNPIADIVDSVGTAVAPLFDVVGNLAGGAMIWSTIMIYMIPILILIGVIVTGYFGSKAMKKSREAKLEKNPLLDITPTEGLVTPTEGLVTPTEGLVTPPEPPARDDEGLMDEESGEPPVLPPRDISDALDVSQLNEESVGDDFYRTEAEAIKT